MSPKIIYEDKDVLVIDKPAGLMVHPPSPKTVLFSDPRTVLGEEPTLVDWLIEKYPAIKNVGDPSTSSEQENLRPGIVHRLDKDTSGVLIIAKNQPAFEYLKNQFAASAKSFGEPQQNHKIKKTYFALVSGKLKEKEGIIDLPIGRSKKSPIRRLASPKARGKLREAITEYKVLKEFWSSQDQRFYTLVEVYPKTGRTHQIRVHFKAISHPVVCDKLYSKNSCLPGLNRQFLHASSLELTLPDGGRNKFEADLPEDLENVLRQLREREKYDSNNR